MKKPKQIRLLRPLLSIVMGLVVVASSLGVDKATAATASTAKGPKPYAVVIIVFDEFSTSALVNASDNTTISKKRFPNFYRLSKQADFYPYNTGVSDLTARAVPSILTGIRPKIETFPTAEAQPDNIYRILDNHNYSINNRELLTEICPRDVCNERKNNQQGSLQGNAERKPGDDPFAFASRKMSTFTKETEWTTRDRAINAISGKKQSFNFIHILSPHEPYQFLPSGQRYESGAAPDVKDEDISNFILNDTAVDYELQRYVMQVGYVDHVLGQVIAKIKHNGNWPNTMLIVTGDHGVSLKQGHERRTISDDNKDDIASTPLFIKYPKQAKGRVVEKLTRTVDIVPTIADALNITLPDDYQRKLDGKTIKQLPDGGTTTRIANVSSNVPNRTKPSDSNEYEAAKAELKQNIQQTTNRYRDALGTGGIYQLGPGPLKLVGKKIKDAGPMFQANSRVAIDKPGQFNNPTSYQGGFVPAFVNGTIAEGSAIDPGQKLAIVVNNKVAGTTRAFHYDKVFHPKNINIHKTMFGFVVSPGLLKPNGGNRIDILVIKDDGTLGQRVGSTKFKD